jgi:hypothetical protein
LSRAALAGWLFRAALLGATAVSVLCGVGCARTHCHTQPLAMHWADGTTTTWPITVCQRRWL